MGVSVIAGAGDMVDSGKAGCGAGMLQHIVEVNWPGSCVGKILILDPWDLDVDIDTSRKVSEMCFWCRAIIV